MPKIQVTSESRVTHDPKSDAIRTCFDPSAESMAQAPFTPRNVARQVLKESAELFPSFASGVVRLCACMAVISIHLIIIKL